MTHACIFSDDYPAVSADIKKKSLGEKCNSLYHPVQQALQTMGGFLHLKKARSPELLLFLKKKTQTFYSK